MPLYALGFERALVERAYPRVKRKIVEPVAPPVIDLAALHNEHNVALPSPAKRILYEHKEGIIFALLFA